MTRETEVPPMNADLAQKRRTVRVLDLLDQSQTAHAAGNRRRSIELFDQAGQIDAAATAAIVGAMKIGEVPRPGSPEWTDYLTMQQHALAAAEHAEQEQRCEVTELIKTQCDHCRHPNQRWPEPLADTQVWTRFTARYPGTCARCGAHFPAGAEIGRQVDEPGWIGPECLP